MHEQSYGFRYRESLWQRLRRRMRENRAAYIWVYHDSPVGELARRGLTKQDAKKGLKRIHVPIGRGVPPFTRQPSFPGEKE